MPSRDKQCPVLIKTPMCALSSPWGGLSLSTRPPTPCRGSNLPAGTRNASLGIPLPGSDFSLCCRRQSLTLNVTTYLIPMKKSRRSPVVRFSGCLGSLCEKALCSFTQCAVSPTSAPTPCSPGPSPQGSWCHCPHTTPPTPPHPHAIAPALLLLPPSPGRWPQQCACPRLSPRPAPRPSLLL